MKSVVAALAAACIMTGALAADLIYRPAQEYRTTTAASYEVSIQKNGRIDVTLTGGAPVFMNAYPMVWLENGEAPEPMRIDGRHTARQEVKDRLGEGQGMIMQYKECEWTHRTYPTEPFFTVQVAFTNTTNKPVRVKALYPWCTESRGGWGKKGQSGFSLGFRTPESVTLEGGKQFPGDITMPGLVRGPTTAMWNLATFNPITGRSLIAGFLTNNTAYTRIGFDQPSDTEDEVSRFNTFTAECVYDPPVEVAPGEKLVSEPLYLGIAEKNPHDGLERFGQAVAAANNVRLAKPFLPHGWDSWSTEYHTDINEAKILANLDFVDAHLKRYGWDHFAIDDGWAIGRGDWEPDPEKFPHGMKYIADQIHSRDMTAGLWIAPFTVKTNTRLAQEHPEWLASPSDLGKQVVGDDERILDITAPGAYEHVRDLAARIGREWGFDALVEADYVYHLVLAESYARKDLTRVEIMRLGMQALREGLGEDRFIMTVPPLPVNAVYAQGVRTGTDCAPVWRQVPGRWPFGCVDTLTDAARRYYFAPWMWVPDQDCAFFGHEGTRERWGVSDQPRLTWDQSIAWLTGAALTGGVLKIGDRFVDLSEQEVAVLRKLLPAMQRPARPVDLFTSKHPQVWSLPVKCAIGEWSLVGLFNWNETAPQTITVSFSDLGLSATAFYTVYGFWEEKYYGTAEKSLSVSVPPGSMRLLCLRPFEDRPMFLSTDRHYSQGATDFTSLEWDAAAKELHGTFDGVADTDYTLRALVPEPYEVRNVSVSCGEATTGMEGRVLVFTFHCEEAGPITWTVRF